MGLLLALALMAFGALSVVTVAEASADTITFEGTPTSTTSTGVWWTEAGMEFYALDPIANVNNGSTGTQGFSSRYMDFHDHDGYGYAGGYVEMRLDGGGTFDVSTLEVYAQPLSGGVATITSNLGDVWTSPVGGNGTATSVALNWTGVTWIRFNSAYDISIDNIVFSAVPEPAGVALLGLGLGVVVASRRRKSTRAAYPKSPTPGPLLGLACDVLPEARTRRFGPLLRLGDRAAGAPRPDPSGTRAPDGALGADPAAVRNEGKAQSR